MRSQHQQKKESYLEQLKEGISKEEQTLKNEIQKESKGLSWFFKSHTFRILLSILLFAALLGGVYYLSMEQSRIYIQDAQIIAPVITLSSPVPGVLDASYVKEGDKVPANTIVARVDGKPIKTKVAGIIISVQNTPGQYMSPQSALVKMIEPDELRVIARVQENKGLSDIKVGQHATFSADAYQGVSYEGVVDSISPAARSGDLVFSISDKRQEQDFDVSVKFQVSAHPELKQGMSAKMYIYK